MRAITRSAKRARARARTRNNEMSERLNFRLVLSRWRLTNVYLFNVPLIHDVIN